MKIKLSSGKKNSICSCGLSKDLPYCDNAHRQFNAENGTNYKSVKITPNSDVTINITSSTWDIAEKDN